jgi:hypothetical protein
MANIFATQKRDRFFLVPDEVQLPPGDLEVRSITGLLLKVDPAAIAAHEVPEEVAKKHVQERVATILEITKELTQLATQVVALKTNAEGAPADGLTATDRAKKILGLVGVSLEDLEKDPKGVIKAVGEKIKTLALEKLKELKAKTGTALQ